MGLILKSIEDGRSNLERARLGELQNFAKENGIAFDPSYGAPVLRQLLIRAGKTDIRPPPRPLGAQYQHPVTPSSHKYVNGMQPAAPVQVREVDAIADLMRQQMGEKTPDQMDIRELRSACKARGVKMARTDNIATLRAKLNGENPS